SIAWLSDWLSTLRGAGYPRPAQDSLPAVGQTLLDGLSTRRVPSRGFGVSATSHPPLPSLPGAIGSTEATWDQSTLVSSDRSFQRYRASAIMVRELRSRCLTEGSPGITRETRPQHGSPFSDRGEPS